MQCPGRIQALLKANCSSSQLGIDGIAGIHHRTTEGRSSEAFKAEDIGATRVGEIECA